MRWLVRLVTPPGGLVVDMFAGSGPTGQAARAEGMRAVLIEADAKHIPFIRARLDAHPRTEAARPDAQVVVEAAAADLFALLDGDGP
jgi:site-specific DNA-methyltransferase (adenine-specific)